MTVRLASGVGPFQLISTGDSHVGRPQGLIQPILCDVERQYSSPTRSPSSPDATCRRSCIALACIASCFKSGRSPGGGSFNLSGPATISSYRRAGGRRARAGARVQRRRGAAITAETAGFDAFNPASPLYEPCDNCRVLCNMRTGYARGERSEAGARRCLSNSRDNFLNPQ